MAPSRKSARTAINAAAEFDFEAFLGEFEEPTFTRPLMRKGAMLPDLTERARILDELDADIERLEKAEEDQERDITDVSPLAKLKETRNRLTLEYNEVAAEYNASAVDFTFRVPNRPGDSEAIGALLEESGLVEPPRPDVDGLDDDEKAAVLAEWEKEFTAYWSKATIRSMSVTCTSHRMTPEQWEALENKVGVVAFTGLRNAWAEAVQAAAPDAPFSLRPLPTQEPDES